MSGRNDGDGEDQIVERLREREDATIVNIWRRTDYEYIEIGRDVQAAIDMGYVAKVGGLKAWIIQKRLKSHTFYFQCLFCYRNSHRRKEIEDWFCSLNYVPEGIRDLSGPGFFQQACKSFDNRNREQKPRQTAESREKQALAVAQWKQKGYDTMVAIAREATQKLPEFEATEIRNKLEASIAEYGDPLLTPLEQVVKALTPVAAAAPTSKAALPAAPDDPPKTKYPKAAPTKSDDKSVPLLPLTATEAKTRAKQIAKFGHQDHVHYALRALREQIDKRGSAIQFHDLAKFVRPTDREDPPKFAGSGSAWWWSPSWEWVVVQRRAEDGGEFEIVVSMDDDEDDQQPDSTKTTITMTKAEAAAELTKLKNAIYTFKDGNVDVAERVAFRLNEIADAMEAVNDRNCDFIDLASGILLPTDVEVPDYEYEGGEPIALWFDPKAELTKNVVILDLATGRFHVAPPKAKARGRPRTKPVQPERVKRPYNRKSKATADHAPEGTDVKNKLTDPSASKDDVIQAICGEFHPRINVAYLLPQPDGLHVDGWDEQKRLMCQALLKSDITGEFSVNILAKHEGRFLTEEEWGSGHQITIKSVVWDAEQSAQQCKSRLLGEIKVAKTKAIREINFTINDGQITIAEEPHDEWRYNLRDLEWVLKKKNITEIKHSTRGVLLAIASSPYGDFRFYVRAYPTY